jgi:hypothetical protein
MLAEDQVNDFSSFSVRTLELDSVRVISAKLSKIRSITAKRKQDFVKAQCRLKGIESVPYSSGPPFMIAAGKIRGIRIVRKGLFFFAVQIAAEHGPDRDPLNALNQGCKRLVKSDEWKRHTSKTCNRLSWSCKNRDIGLLSRCFDLNIIPLIKTVSLDLGKRGTPPFTII